MTTPAELSPRFVASGFSFLIYNEAWNLRQGRLSSRAASWNTDIELVRAVFALGVPKRISNRAAFLRSAIPPTHA